MNQLALALFAVMLLAAFAFFLDAQFSRKREARANERAAEAERKQRIAEEALTHANDVAEVKERPVAENAAELRRLGVFDDPGES